MEGIEDGPTAVIPRSYQDQSLNPYNGSVKELFLARKEDVIMWGSDCGIEPTVDKRWLAYYSLSMAFMWYKHFRAKAQCIRYCGL